MEPVRPGFAGCLVVGLFVGHGAGSVFFAGLQSFKVSPDVKRYGSSYGTDFDQFEIASPALYQPQTPLKEPCISVESCPQVMETAILGSAGVQV